MCVLAIANIMATDSNGKPSCNGSVGGLMCSVYKTNINTPPTHPLQVQSFLWNFSSGSFVCSHFLTSSDPVSLWKVHIIDICIGDSCIRGEREFPFPVPGKRKFWPGIKTGNTIIIFSFAGQGMKINHPLNLTLLFIWFPGFPGIPGITSLKFPIPFPSRSIF